MPSFLAKQPNGLYCRFSSIIDTVTDYNMTREEYIQMRMEKARQEAEEILDHRIQSFDEVKRQFVPNNDTVEEFNGLLLEMGCKENELLNPNDYETSEL